MAQVKLDKKFARKASRIHVRAQYMVGGQAYTVESKVMTASAWAKFEAAMAGTDEYNRWQAVSLENGLVHALAVHSGLGDNLGEVPPRRQHGPASVEDPDRTAAVRDLRNKLVDFLEAECGDNVSMSVEGEGGAEFRVDHPPAPGRCRESIRIRIARDRND